MKLGREGGSFRGDEVGMKVDQENLCEGRLGGAAG